MPDESQEEKQAQQQAVPGEVDTEPKNTLLAESLPPESTTAKQGQRRPVKKGDSNILKTVLDTEALTEACTQLVLESEEKNAVSTSSDSLSIDQDSPARSAKLDQSAASANLNSPEASASLGPPEASADSPETLASLGTPEASVDSLEAAANLEPASPPRNLGPPPPPRRVVKKMDPKVLKTVLDTEACTEIVSRLTAKKEVQLKEMIETTVVEPPKTLEPIENIHIANACDAKWNGPADSLNFEICQNCKLHVYDFSNMDFADVKKLVLKREGKAEPSFFRRQDGKFLTSNCPVGRRRIVATTALVAAGTIILLGLIVLAVKAPSSLNSTDTIKPNHDGINTNSIKSKSAKANANIKSAATTEHPRSRAGRRITRVFSMVANSVVEDPNLDSSQPGKPATSAPGSPVGKNALPGKAVPASKANDSEKSVNLK